MQTDPMNALTALIGDDVEPRAREAGADVARLIPGLAVAMRRARWSGDAMTASQRVFVARIMMRRLYAAGDFREVAFLGDVFRREVLSEPGMFRQLGRAYKGLKRTDDLIALATATLPPGTPDDVAKAQYGLRLSSSAGPNLADYLREWGPVPRSLDAALADLRTDHVRSDNLRDLARALMIVRGEKTLSAKELEDRLAWGRAAGDYMFFLARFRGSSSNSSEITSEERQLVALANEIEAMYQPADMSTFLARRDEGRSLLVAENHAGSTSFNRKILLRSGLPDTLVAGNSRTDLETHRAMKLGVRGDSNRDFLKLVKILKRQQRLIRIFPDGHAGERREMPFLGTTVSFGLGAATLGWHANAAIFTSGSSWRGGRLGMVLHEGPLVDKSADREAFDDAFYAFYADTLRAIALGPPEDIVGHGGIWTTLIRAFADPQSEKADCQ
ncbi:MAG: hypothetical protein ACPGFA_02175 [Pikeienuella sp.]